MAISSLQMEYSSSFIRTEVALCDLTPVVSHNFHPELLDQCNLPNPGHQHQEQDDLSLQLLPEWDGRQFETLLARTEAFAWQHHPY